MICRSPEEFGILLKALASDAVDAIQYFQLHQNVVKSIPKYEIVFNESQSFWSKSLNGLLNSSIFSLCRIYDQENNSLSLPNFLSLAKDKLEYFADDAFLARTKENKHAIELSNNRILPTIEDIEFDISCVNKNNEIIKKLVIWRGNIFAHKSPKSAILDYSTLKENPISKDEINEIALLAISIINKYSSLFDATEYMIGCIGSDDYLSLLKFAKIGIEL
jgi:hypothetical protein